MKWVSSHKLLLDVNVLLALAWPNHQFHAVATGRLESSKERWATCALTELGFLRLSTNPAVVGSAVSPSEAAALLAKMVSDTTHIYLGEIPSPENRENLGDIDRLMGPKQLTDLYLLRVAGNSSARFPTFDTRLEALARNLCSVEVLGRVN